MSRVVKRLPWLTDVDHGSCYHKAKGDMVFIPNEVIQ